MGGAPVAAVFVGMNEWMYGTLAAPFFFASRAHTASLGLHHRLGEALLGNLISPSRGLLVYTPIVLFSLAGVYLWIRDKPYRRLGLYVGAAFAAHYLLMSSYEDWYGGHCYGPRYMSDLSPLFALALVPLQRAARYALIPALAVSLFMHAQGALCWPCVDWNSAPLELRHNESRLWDWRDPPFLRNFKAPISAPAPAHARPDASWPAVCRESASPR